MVDVPLTNQSIIIPPEPQGHRQHTEHCTRGNVLPDDIVRAILDCIHSSGDAASLYACGLVCKQFTTYARKHLFKQITLYSNVSSVGRLKGFLELLKRGNSSLVEGTEKLELELGDGHRWIFSKILTPPFRTSDPRFYDELREQRRDLDRTISNILLLIAGAPGNTSPIVASPTPSFPHIAARPHRSLRELVVSHHTFYPVSSNEDHMTGWQRVFGLATLEKLSMKDISDFPLALLGHAGEGMKNIEFLRVKLDRRDTQQMWTPLNSMGVSALSRGNRGDRVRPKVLSIRDCYSETIDPLIACASNPESFLDFGGIEQLTVHPCLMAQAAAYQRLLNAVIQKSEVFDHLVWMSPAQRQEKDLEACLADFTRFRKVDLIFTDGFGGFSQLLTEIRDLLHAATCVSLPPTPNPGESQAGLPRFAPSTSALEELTLRFDLENLTMHSTPESILPGVSSTPGSGSHTPIRVPSGIGRADTESPPKSLYYAHIKYIWKLDEKDMGVLRDIDRMLSGPPEPIEGMHAAGGGCYLTVPHSDVSTAYTIREASPESPKSPFMMSDARTAFPTTPGWLGERNDFPHFKRLSTTCVYQPASSYMLDDWKAADVYEACRTFVQGGLPRLKKSGKLHFAFEKV